MSSKKGSRTNVDLQAALTAGEAPPRLVVRAHDSPSQEDFTRNGVIRSCHVVVKNTALSVTLGLKDHVVGGQAVDFTSFTMMARLFYDTDDEKEVDFVKVQPLEARFHVDPKAPDTCKAELKVKVLTSQHEDMFFRARLVALDARTGQEFTPSIWAWSEPIKVISKPEQLKKRKPAKKRTLTDILVDTLTRIETHQADQARLLQRLTSKDRELTGLAASVLEEDKHAHRAGSAAAGASAGAATGAAEWDGATKGPLDFEQAFANFVTSYQALAQEERPEKIRKVLRQSTNRDLEQLGELVDLMASEGLQHVGGASPFGDESSKGCSCVRCPHKAELARIDVFYKEFLSAPVLDPLNPTVGFNFS